MSLSQTAFVTTCKGRLDHLKQSLPRLVALKPAEIIVVDYDCPQGTADWVAANFPTVKIVRKSNAPLFNLSDARNIGAAASKSDWIFFCDADILFYESIKDWFAATKLDVSKFYRPHPTEAGKYTGVCGSCLVPRHAFDFIKGYDDVITGWGAEDDDFYFRLNDTKTQEVFFEKPYLTAIEHSDHDRMKFNSIKKKSNQHRINMSYVRLKRLIMATMKTSDLPRGGKLEIMRQVIKVCANEPGAQIEQGTIAINLSPRFVSDDSNMLVRVTFDFKTVPR